MNNQVSNCAYSTLMWTYPRMPRREWSTTSRKTGVLNLTRSFITPHRRMYSIHALETSCVLSLMGSTEQSWFMAKPVQEKLSPWVEACKTISIEVSSREPFPKCSRKSGADLIMSTQFVFHTLRFITNLCLTWYHQCQLVNNRAMLFPFKMMPRGRFMSRDLLRMFAKTKRKL